MTHKTMLALAAALIAAFATPALAQGHRHSHYDYQSWSTIDTGTSSGRESLVRATR